MTGPGLSGENNQEQGRPDIFYRGAELRKGLKMLFGDNLVIALREMAENAQKRFWAYTPYLGAWDGVKRIIGDNWQLKGAVQVRLLTDIRNRGWIDPITFQAFRKRGDVATLPGLHAKIYVSDDTIMITSANLTQTAFQKRYEAGIVRKCTIADENYINLLWENSLNIPQSWKPIKAKRPSDKDEQGGSGLGKMWNLPASPRGTGDKTYENSLSAFSNFRNIYLANVKRGWPKTPAYFEIDGFLNYLFHEHDGTPSEKYKNGGFAKLSEKERIERLKKYHKPFNAWLKTYNKSDSFVDYAGHREIQHKRVRRLLSPKRVVTASWQDIETAFAEVWALQGNPLNRAKFFNRGNQTNNSLRTVRDAIGYLFNDSNGSISSRFRYCQENLVGLGSGAIGELIGYYYPDQFPLANNNSLSGLRFFGYEVLEKEFRAFGS